MKVIRNLIGPIVGAAGGYAYYHYVGCASGTCVLSSNAWFMVAYGAIVGLTLGDIALRVRKGSTTE